MRRSTLRIALTVVALAIIAALRLMRHDGADAGQPGASPTTTTAAHAEPPRPPVGQSAAPADSEDRESTTAPVASASLVDAERRRQSNVWVEGSGTVEATLPDDHEGAKHQKFVVRINRELTVLVSHNIDLAPRVPLDRGDLVAFRGEYVWNRKGGLVHWTHHDPRGGRGGWIRLDNEVYE